MDFKEYYQDKGVVSSYDSTREKGWKSRVVRKLELACVDLLVGKKKQEILEIGVGTGFISKLLISKGDFYGMDISDEMLNKAGSFVKSSRLIKGDILNLNIKKKFDMVVSIRVISHFDKKDALHALKNIKSILSEEGEVVFNLENVSYFRRAMRKITNWGSTYTFQYSNRDISELLDKAGLKKKK